jgi:hypothetical protein
MVGELCGLFDSGVEGQYRLLYATKFSSPLGSRLILALCRRVALAAELEQAWLIRTRFCR